MGKKADEKLVHSQYDSDPSGSPVSSGIIPPALPGIRLPVETLGLGGHFVGASLGMIASLYASLGLSASLAGVIGCLKPSALNDFVDEQPIVVCLVLSFCPHRLSDLPPSCALVGDG